MSVFDRENVLNRLIKNLRLQHLTYKQYLHKDTCKVGPCDESPVREKDLCCKPFIGHIHASDKLHNLPKHPHCDCYYKDVAIRPLGSISNREPAPDIYLKMYGKLPDYYISMDEAKALGWSKGKDLSLYAPGKMIGGEPYENREKILPEKEGRDWYHCDINYENGLRNNQRLYYSNDGLMFYSPTHLDEWNVKVYWVK